MGATSESSCSGGILESSCATGGADSRTCRAKKTPSTGARIVADTMAARHCINFFDLDRETVVFMMNLLAIASPVRIPSLNGSLFKVGCALNDGSVHLIPSLQSNQTCNGSVTVNPDRQARKNSQSKEVYLTVDCCHSSAPSPRPSLFVWPGRRFARNFLCAVSHLLLC